MSTKESTISGYLKTALKDKIVIEDDRLISLFNVPNSKKFCWFIVDDKANLHSLNDKIIKNINIIGVNLDVLYDVLKNKNEENDYLTVHKYIKDEYMIEWKELGEKEKKTVEKFDKVNNGVKNIKEETLREMLTISVPLEKKKDKKDVVEKKKDKTILNKNRIDEVIKKDTPKEKKRDEKENKRVNKSSDNVNTNVNGNKKEEAKKQDVDVKKIENVDIPKKVEKEKKVEIKKEDKKKDVVEKKKEETVKEEKSERKVSNENAIKEMIKENTPKEKQELIETPPKEIDIVISIDNDGNKKMVTIVNNKPVDKKEKDVKKTDNDIKVEKDEIKEKEEIKETKEINILDRVQKLKEEKEKLLEKKEEKGVVHDDFIKSQVPVQKIRYTVLSPSGKVIFNSTIDNYIPMTVSEYLARTGLQVETDENDFVQSINDIKSEGMMGWVFLVNGKFLPIPADQYIINPEDEITWKYVDGTSLMMDLMEDEKAERKSL